MMTVVKMNDDGSVTVIRNGETRVVLTDGEARAVAAFYESGAQARRRAADHLSQHAALGEERAKSEFTGGFNGA